MNFALRCAGKLLQRKIEKPTRQFCELFTISWPAAFLDFCKKVIVTMVCARDEVSFIFVLAIVRLVMPVA